jgi:hypothetical protein
MTKLLGVIRDVYHMANISSLKSKKCKEIAQIQQMIEDNVKQFEFLDKEEHDIVQINFDLSIEESTISQLEKDLSQLLKTPCSQRNNAEFESKSNKLYNFIQQQDILRANRSKIMEHYQENLINFNNRRHELTQRLEQCKQELYALEERVHK